MEYGTCCRGRGGRRTLIRFGTYNIRNIWNGGLESALRGMGQTNMDAGMFQEKKLIDGIYTRGLAGYKVFMTSASIRHRGGVALFYRDSPNFVVDAIRQFGVNLITCQLETGERRWYIVGCYLALGDRATIQDVETSMNSLPRGTELIVVWDINVNF